MAKLPALPSAKDIAALRGVLWFGMDRGVIVCKRWPRPRPGKGTKNQQRTRDEFKRMAALAHEITSLDRDTAEQLAKGSQYTWRDVISRAAVGALIEYEEVQIQGIQRELDSIQTTVGTVLLRTEDGWIGLLPGTPGQQLAIDETTFLPAWNTPSAPAAGGFWSTALPPVPTLAGSGLTTWLNQGTATAADGPAGITMTLPAGAGAASLQALHKPAPTPPYRVVALSTWQAAPTPGNAAGIGWYDGSSKLQLIYTEWNGQFQLAIESWNSATSFNTGNGTLQYMGMLLLQSIRDDGTNVSFEYSFDGHNWATLYTVAKSSGFLGATGYNRIAFIGRSANVRTTATLQAFSD